MKKNTETAKIPMINQVLKDAALGHLAECGLPQSLISGVDCSSYERMEETLLEVKNCFYSSVRKNIEDTYGPSCRAYTPDDEYKHLMEYKERDYWKCSTTWTATQKATSILQTFTASLETM